MITKRDCIGCTNTFYSECWSFKDAKMIKRIVIELFEPPPYLNKPVIMKPNCFHEGGKVYINPSKLNKEGFWG